MDSGDKVAKMIHANEQYARTKRDVSTQLSAELRGSCHCREFRDLYALQKFFVWSYIMVHLTIAICIVGAIFCNLGDVLIMLFFVGMTHFIITILSYIKVYYLPRSHNDL